MKRIKSTGLYIYTTLLAVLLLSENVHAYLDPGTGSMIIQLCVAFLVAISATVKIYWKKIKGFFVKN